MAKITQSRKGKYVILITTPHCGTMADITNQSQFSFQLSLAQVLDSSQHSIPGSSFPLIRVVTYGEIYSPNLSWHSPFTEGLRRGDLRLPNKALDDPRQEPRFGAHSLAA